DIEFGELTEIFTEADDFGAVRKSLEEAGIKLEEANLVYEPNNPMELDQSQTLQVMNFIEKIEDLDDVQNVYSTLEISDEAIAAMEAG
ncbi:MAG: YebC/PmpR family DNA-binding transcriptional regulator, partial [Anaerolineae bacterium]